MFKKAKKLMCILLVVLMVMPYAVQASAYKETEAFYGVFSKIFYIVDGNAFYLSNEIMEKALTDEGAIIYLPEETAGKRIDVYGFAEWDHFSCNTYSYYGVVDGKILMELYQTDGPNEKYTLYFYSSDYAEYDESRRIGTSDSSFKFFFYRDDDRMVFLEQHEIDELTEKKIVKIEDPNIKNGDMIVLDQLGCLADRNVSQSGATVEIPRYEYFACIYGDADMNPLYEIYVNYDNYVRYENRWYTALEKLLEILERLYDFLFGFIL